MLEKLRKVPHAVALAILYSPLALANLVLTVALRERPRFLDKDDYTGLAVLERSWPLIRKELDELLEAGTPIPRFDDVDDGQTRLAMDGRWKTFIFRVYGQDVPDNQARCPETARLLAGIPEISMAMFSILEPGKRLPLHIGAYRGVLRYYLPLRVPDTRRCAVQVGGEVRHLEEGRALLFDDVFVHTAWNESDEDRVVLFIDVERRMPHRWLTALNRLVLRIMSRTRRVRGAAERARVAAS